MTACSRWSEVIRTLFVWDADTSSSRRRMFYKRLSGYSQGGYTYEGVLDELPEESWNRINMSTLLVEGNGQKLRELFEEFDEILDWHEFEVREKKEQRPSE